MNPLLSLDSSSTESDVFYVERSSEEGSPARNNTPVVFTSPIQHSYQEQWLGRRLLSPPSLRWLEPQMVTIDSDSNEPTIPYGFGSQHPIVPPSHNDINLLPNPFKVLATIAVHRADEEYSLQSPEPSILSTFSTPPLNVSTIESWETTHTTTDDATLYSKNEPRRVFWDISSSETFDSSEPRHVSTASSPSSTPPPPRQQKRKLSKGMSFPKEGEDRSTPVRYVASRY